ncbi:MAG: tetratricopeptide repeat protein [Burkholderiales bacterium]|nr:tetratricopeptide repeat protein [Burkholderiales bacterium]
MSVISRMLNDLESRGASVPVSRPVPTWVAAADQAALMSDDADGAPKGPVVRGGQAWLRAALLLGGVLVSGAAWYGAQESGWWQDRHTFHAASLSAHEGAPSVAPKASAVANAISTWRMDWALSLGMLKSPVHSQATQVSLSPKQDVGGDAVDAAEHADGEPPHVEASPTQSVTQIAIIDPPAAGRVQSMATQAVEAYRRAMDLADQGREGVALDAALQAIKLDPQHMPARRLAIALALDQKQVDQAGALIDEGLKLTPRDSELLFLHARRLALAGANDQALSVLQGLDRTTGEALGLKAGLLARTGQYASAAQAYQQALKTRPDNATWWLGLGVALNAQGQGAMAKEAFLRARKLGQLSPDVQAWLDQQL